MAAVDEAGSFSSSAAAPASTPDLQAGVINPLLRR
jgi:hypothetical protein